MNYRRLWGQSRTVNTGLPTVKSVRVPVRFNDVFAAYWTRVREEREQSMEEFAKLVGVPESTAGFIERGTRSVTAYHLDRLAKALQKPVSDILAELAEQARELEPK